MRGGRLFRLTLSLSLSRGRWSLRLTGSEAAIVWRDGVAVPSQKAGVRALTSNDKTFWRQVRSSEDIRSRYNFP
jgi:hypothetical protein